MNKAELVQVVANEAGTTQKDAETIINLAMKAIIETVASGERTIPVGFGSFVPRERSARAGRNPKTNEPLIIPAKTVAFFRASKEFNYAVGKKGGKASK